MIAETTPGARRAPGDRPDPFEAFYRTHFTAAVRLAHLLSGDASVADDLAQDAFERVRQRFSSVSAPRAYLRTAVVNACRSHHRGRSREAVRTRKVAVPAHSELGARELLDAVDALPYRQKAVIVLRYYEDLSERDIALAVGCRPGTVKSLASRALRRLAEEIQQ